MDLLEGLSSVEKERFRKTSNYLLNHTYLLKEIYEPKDKVGKINADYRFIERYFDKFKEILNVLGYDLNKDDESGVISVNNRYDYNYLKLDKYTTLMLLTLRLIYMEEKEKNNSRNVVFINNSDIIVRMFNEKLIQKKPTIKENSSAIRKLIKNNILSRFDGNIDSNEATYVIYPSVEVLVSNEKIDALYSILTNNITEGDEENEEA